MNHTHKTYIHVSYFTRSHWTREFRKNKIIVKISVITVFNIDVKGNLQVLEILVLLVPGNQTYIYITGILLKFFFITLEY